MFRFNYLIDKPLVDVNRLEQLEGNANGPCVIKVPHWVTNPAAKYYMYFAHHEGSSIRLAFADELTGPWRMSEKPALDLANSLFLQTPPLTENLAAEALQYIQQGSDGDYPHIASPDIFIDESARQIRLYYHGRLHNGLQRTRVALSSDGLNFCAQQEILGMPYLRVFQHEQVYYALGFSGYLYRSRNGIDGFECGARITQPDMRHFAIFRYQQHWLVFWTRINDSPERIYVSTLATDADWKNWSIEGADEIHRPRRAWEGADLPLLSSRLGTSMDAVNQLRDPYIYTEDERIFLFYSIAGEQGIAMGELTAE